MSSRNGLEKGGPGRPRLRTSAAALLEQRRDSERRRQAALREGIVSEGGSNFSMMLRKVEAEALLAICKRDRLTRSDAVRAALVAYAGARKS